MNNLIIIPARKNSKGIKNKNTILDIDEFQDLMYYKFLINKSVLK